ncbi:MAG: immunoglobulin-like domain-containing protein, partial [Dolichospermum sp.]
FNKYNEFGAVAKDNQNNIIPNNNITITGSVDTTKLGGYNLNYTVLDAFGMMATVNRLVTVGDTTRPLITPNYTGGRSFYIHQVKTSIDMEKVVTVTDNYWKGLTPNWLGTVDVNNVGSYFIPYNVTDLSGNIANQVMVEIRVTDNIAPVIQLNGNNPLKWEVYRPFVDPGYTVTDNVWPRNTVAITMKPAVIPVNSLGSITRWYIATDPSGNKDSVSRTINIVDETKPVVKILGGETVNINRWCEFVDPGVELQDNYNSDAEMRQPGRFVVTSTLPNIPNTTNRWFGDVPGLYSMTYRVTDLSGNQSDLAIRYIRVSADPCVTSLEEVLNIDKLMSVYPNPSTGVFNFRLVQSMDEDVNIIITDIQGKEVA